jgi:hypothetical protein
MLKSTLTHGALDSQKDYNWNEHPNDDSPNTKRCFPSAETTSALYIESLKHSNINDSMSAFHDLHVAVHL